MRTTTATAEEKKKKKKTICYLLRDLIKDGEEIVGRHVVKPSGYSV